MKCSLSKEDRSEPDTLPVLTLLLLRTHLGARLSWASVSYKQDHGQAHRVRRKGRGTPDDGHY